MAEFISRDLDLWAYVHDVVLDFSRPGKSTDNALIEAFNGRFRAECLNARWFLSALTTLGKNLRLGVLTTTSNASMAPSGTRSRFRCKITMAHPAGHRDRTPETPTSGDPKSGGHISSHLALVSTEACGPPTHFDGNIWAVRMRLGLVSGQGRPGSTFN